MEKQIIDGPMDIDQRIKLESAIYDIVKTSMNQRCLSMAWWETYCSVDFFNELNEVTDDFGNVLGKGIETEDCIYVLNGMSESDFTTAFLDGRDRAIQEIKKKHAPNPMTWMAPIIGGMGG